MFGPPQVRQIVQLLAYTTILVAEHFFSIKGTRRPEIARNLNISVGTARYHVARLRMDGRYKP